ncbi:nucleoside hydrolase [Actinopolymorpha pittospori]
MIHPAQPADRRTRVIVDTDAKNEADDQYALVHALLTPSFEIHGVIAAHFGTRRSDQSMEDSREEVDLVLELMGRQGRVPVANGAPTGLPDETTPVPSPGSALIVQEALRDDPRPLHVAFYGPLTDMASALLTEPAIQDRNVRVVWIGGGEYPDGGREFNLSNDIHAANVVLGSRLEVWQIPRSVYRLMAVGYAELMERVAPHGPLGRYLVDQLVEWNARWVDGPMEYRSLGDSPAVGVMMYPDCGRWQLRPAPTIDADMRYVHDDQNPMIRVYDSVDARFVLEDFYAKLARFASGRL